MVHLQPKDFYNGHMTITSKLNYVCTAIELCFIKKKNNELAKFLICDQKVDIPHELFKHNGAIFLFILPPIDALISMVKNLLFILFPHIRLNLLSMLEITKIDGLL